jgi:hypothetical protein
MGRLERLERSTAVVLSKGRPEPTLCTRTGPLRTGFPSYIRWL